jgi:hypothetical protein
MPAAAQKESGRTSPSSLLKQQQLARELARDDGRSYGELAQASIDEHASSIKVVEIFTFHVLLKYPFHAYYQNA